MPRIAGGWFLLHGKDNLTETMRVRDVLHEDGAHTLRAVLRTGPHSYSCGAKGFDDGFVGNSASATQNTAAAIDTARVI